MWVPHQGREERAWALGGLPFWRENPTTLQGIAKMIPEADKYLQERKAGW